MAGRGEKVRAVAGGAGVVVVHNPLSAVRVWRRPNNRSNGVMSAASCRIAWLSLTARWSTIGMPSHTDVVCCRGQLCGVPRRRLTGHSPFLPGMVTSSKGQFALSGSWHGERLL
ncbi:hypothetical protein SUGI_0795360 [Cryptomeria japonica]|nr:hypothetical protein SUGI_0795360 [Cryptomeria japonica]